MENQTSPINLNGASFSSTAGDSNHTSSDIPYDVFINHRGEVKKTFASHLYRGLLSRGLRPFLDQQELAEGLPFPSQIGSAIRSASVHVAIFSPKYAESYWCLVELLHMRKSGAPIIPVFYHVNPADLRWTDQNKNGVYGRALHQLQMKKTFDSQSRQEKSRYDSAIIQNWRDALSSVADISGFELDGPFNGDEGYMLEKIVERVVKMCKKPELYVAKYPTGLNEKVTDFETTVLKLQDTGKVQVVGIVGLGGMGKTTLALELFNRKRSKYDKSYFLSDVRENANKSSLHSLQRVLLKGLGVNELDLHMDSIYEGIGMFKRHLNSSCVFLVLDGIDHQDQLEALLPGKDLFHENSLILITSRDQDVLARSGLENKCIYKLTGLNRQHSQELFCSYAFCQPYPLHGFEDLVHKFLRVCDGLPLSLKVFGALLFGKNDKSDWEDILQQLEVPTEIQKRLKVSYDALRGEEQEIFLDIACFFIGENKNSVITVWDGSGWKGLLGFKNLEGKCLIEVDHKNVIHMHDHLRDLGRDIAQYKSPLRLWRSTGHIDDWLHKESNVITKARGIRLLRERHSTGGTSSQMLSLYQRSHQLLGNSVMKLFNRMSITRYCFLCLGVRNLQILETEGHLLERISRVHWPNLIWLSWSDCPYTYLPSWVLINNLRVLNVEGRVLETLWQDKWQAFLQLRVLIIDAKCLRSIPKSIGQLKYLERIVIFSPSLVKLPEEVCHLESLKVLELTAYPMKSLPESLGMLTNLRHMDLSWCRELKRLPDTLGSLINLHHMDLSWCEKLERLPYSLGGLTNLYHMDLSRCNWERLPDSLGSLMNLYHMDLCGCTKLERLPDSMGSLMNLHHMDLSGCEKLERLPDSLGGLTNLHRMHLCYCEKLERLPDSFAGLTNLHHINLQNCRKLERLPDSFGSMMNLHHVDLYRCERLERLPNSFGSMMNLHHMDMSRCKKLERLPNSFGMMNLHHIDLSRCKKLERLPDSLGSLTNLHHVDLSFCKKLERLPDSFGSLTNLQHISLAQCEKLERLPDSFGSLSCLKCLDASGCSNLTISSHTVGNIRTLEHIDISGCEKIEVWPWQLVHQRSLKILKLTGTNLKELPSAIEVLSDLEVLWIGSPLLDTLLLLLGDLRNLKELALKDCRELKCLPSSIGRLSQLTKLVVTGCPVLELPFMILKDRKKLKCLPASVGQLSQLSKLEMAECNFKKVRGQRETVRTLKCDSYLPRLQYLELQDTEISEVSFDEGVLPNLKEFKLEKCINLVEVGTLLNTLTYLELSSCYNLKSIEGLSGLAMLRKLKIEKCNELQELPSVKTLVSLEYLWAFDCVKLKSIWDLAQLTKLRCVSVSGCLQLEGLEIVYHYSYLLPRGVPDCIWVREPLRGCVRTV